MKDMLKVYGDLIRKDEGVYLFMLIKIFGRMVMGGSWSVNKEIN